MADPVPQKRQAITDLERRNIRRRRDTTGETQKELIAWFAAQPSGRPLTQGQISTILSPTYAYLDTDPRKTSQLGSKRRFKGDYPDLEDALFHWQQQMQKKKAIITGDILRAQAHQIWNRLLQYNGEEEPKWSNGWLDRFKKRYNIKEYRQHGEGASAEVNTPVAIQQMENLRLECSNYHPRDIFNMDETGLFWKLQPDRSLATKQTSGGKKSKDRITIALCANGDGSEKLNPWIIGRSKNPRCFKHINRKNLRIIYRHNKSKWMTGIICEEWLHWFDKLMAGRKVLLLLDNFSGHELGVEKVGSLDGLRNVTIRWLPPNTTSHWQPLDQGIIASFKLYYRRQWVEYIVRMLNSDKDPNKTVTLLKAIQWTRIAWNDYVTDLTILRCYWKSTIIEKPANRTIVDEGIAEREALRVQISHLPGIQDPLPVDEFIEPLAEQVVDEDSDIMEAIVAIYGHDENEDEEEVEGEPEEPLPLLADAIEALTTLQRFELSRDDGSRSIRALDQLSREFSALMFNNKTQTTIDSFFSAK
jgi:hypothetical protein